MNSFLTFLFCLIVSTSTSFAQLSDKSVDKAIKGFIISLNHYNHGVVESAIDNVLCLKLKYPKRDYSKIIQKLDEMSLGNKQKTIRTKAFVVANYLKYPQQYNWLKQSHKKEDIKRLLNSLSSMMHLSLNR